MSQYERIPPHNDDAEKSVLGSILLDKEALYEVLEILKPEDFYSEMHKEIYSAIIELYRKSQPVDILTVSEELKKRKSLDMVGGRAYIALLSTVVPSTSNAGEYAKIIAEKAILRKLIGTASDIIEKGYQERMDSSEVLDFAERGIFEIAQSRQSKDYALIKDVLWDNIAKIDEMSKLEGNITGLTTGFSRSGLQDLRTSAVGSDHAGGPSEHGKDCIRSEHRPACGDQGQGEGPHLQPGNVPGPAGAAYAQHGIPH